jgi:SAM-dependent methyltransferase
MALLKLYRHARQHGIASTLKKTLGVLPGYARWFYLWRIRRCGCCERLTIFLCSSPYPEFRACLFCSANERYELLATEIRDRYKGNLPELDVLELDPFSPLRGILCAARSFTRTFYDSQVARGDARSDGALCEDITALTFDDESFDLIVSSDVLEHVPLLDKAFKETARVLRPGGVHLFTVPPRAKTKKRAEVVDGKIHHIETPDYHRDPLSASGILAFWDVGPDLPVMFGSENLDIRIVRGPVGSDGRVVWIAERRISL